MTDRELLEKAARAAGYKWRWYVAPVGQLFQIHDGFLWNYWSPLTDDGDALRLAVRLNIPVIPYDDETSTGTMGVVATNWSSKEENTRRAIVRAAAAIADSTAEKE